MTDLNRLLDDALRDLREDLLRRMAAVRNARTAAEFCAAERGLHELARRQADQLTARLLAEIAGDDERARSARASYAALAKDKGATMDSKGRRPTQVQLLGGTRVELRTLYMHVRNNGPPREQGKRGPDGTGVYPVLDQLGITERSTPALRLCLAREVAEANSVAVARESLAARGLMVDHKRTLALTYRTCDDALAARTAAMWRTRRGNPNGEYVGRHVVIAVDGGRIRTRKRRRGRAKKGGRGPYDTPWREPKVITLYVLGEDGRRDRTVRSVIDGTLGDSDAVFRLLLFHLRKMGAHLAASLTFVADGARWIWTRIPWLREKLGVGKDGLREVVDYFHALQRLHDFATNQPWTDEYRNTWVARQKERLKRGAILEILHAFAQMRGPARAGVAKEKPYWLRNQYRMQYRRFRADNIPLRERCGRIRRAAGGEPPDEGEQRLLVGATCGGNPAPPRPPEDGSMERDRGGRPAPTDLAHSQPTSRMNSRSSRPVRRIT